MPIIQEGDLSFRKGEVIIITKKTDSTDDWYVNPISHSLLLPSTFHTGQVDGKT